MEKRLKIIFNIIAIVCIILFCFAITPITLQNDTFYTIKIGEYILENKIDMHDPFSIHDIPYTYPHWLYDVAIYYIFNIGGMLGIYISTVVLCCILGVTIYIVNKKISQNDLTSFFLTLGVMYVLSNFVAARAQLVTFILFTIQIFLIEKFIDTKKIWYGIGLVVIPTIIANVHSAVWPFYFVPFLPYVVEYLIALLLDAHLVYKVENKVRKYIINSLGKKQGKEEKIEELRKKEKLSQEKFENLKNRQLERRENPYKIKIVKKDNVKWLILIIVICILTGLLTPLGTTPYTYLIKTMQGNTTKSINEHLPMVLIESSTTIAIIVIALSILIFTDTKIRLKDFFMLSGLILLALMTRRQLSLLALLGVYSINLLLCDLFNKYDPKGTEQFMKIITSGFGSIITVLLAILVCIVIYKPKVKANYIDEKAYPVEAAKYIKENLNIEEIRLYNEYNFGSYLLYEGIPVFIDSRADLYTPEFNGDKDKDIFSDFIKVSALSVHYETIFNKYHITHLIMPKNAKMGLFISKDTNYKELYTDDNFVIYERLNVE